MPPNECSFTKPMGSNGPGVDMTRKGQKQSAIPEITLQTINAK